jgi:hypothetical protein
MKSDYKDFIGVYTDVFPKGFCEHLISQFEHFQSKGAGTDRQKGEGARKHYKEDYQINCNAFNCSFEGFEGNNSVSMLFQGLQACFEEYSTEISVVKNIQMYCSNLKMQKTTSGGGYHVWHSEQGNGDQANRGLAYMLYLNSLPHEANGETEFLYQQRRITPVENTMVLWPAAFTHAHRGNPVYGDNAKYIVTGWFYHE